MRGDLEVISASFAGRFFVRKATSNKRLMITV